MINELIQQLLDGDTARNLIEGLPRSKKSKQRSGLRNKDMHKYLKSNIRKGNVLVVGPVRGNKPAVVKAFYKINTTLFGPNSSHVDMYAGKDRVITADDRGVVTKSLRRMSDKRDHITVMRPTRMSQKNRRRALKFANKQVGKPFSNKTLIGAAIKEFAPKAPAGILNRANNAYICSGLLAHSLERGGVRVHNRKSASFVAPRDFRRSKHSKKVMSFDRDLKSDKWSITSAAARRRKRRKQTTRGGAVR